MRTPRSGSGDPSPDGLAASLRPVLGAGIILIPLCISPSGVDAFRLPKDLVLRATVIILTAILAGSMIRKPSAARNLARLPESRWIGVIIGWVGLSAATALNRFAALTGLLNVVVAALFFLCSVIAFKQSRWPFLLLLLIPALINALLALGQGVLHTAPWPLAPASPTGLLGNGNDLGASLIAPFLVAIAVALATRSRTRVAMIASAALLGGGLLVSRTLTAMIAAAAGALALLMLANLRRGKLIAAACIVAALSLPLVYPPLTQRTADSISWLLTRNYDRVLTFRLTPFLAAWNMATHHPILGVGPGGFAPNYFDWKVKLEERFPRLLHHPFEEQQNFGEAHNDHLQIMAEVGFPGYALFLLSIAAIARISWTSAGGAGTDTRQSLAHLLALPLMLSLAVLALAQFPLHLPAPLAAYLYCGAACRAWARPDHGST